jgi:hypothetical protein
MAAAFETYAGRPGVLFTDVDGTITTAKSLASSTYRALCDLAEAGLPVVVVTGRPAGWCDALVRLWPVAAAIAENGAITFVRDGASVSKRYAVAESEIPALRERMFAAAGEARALVSGARMSADSRYREIDLAIDWNEDASLDVADADRMVALLRDRGFEATRSSVHVNFGPPGIDKMTGCRAYLEVGGQCALGEALYVGDALNDAPLFAGFPHSVGVANVRDVWDELPHRPRYVTAAAEGAGFEEVAAALLAGR